MNKLASCLQHIVVREVTPFGWIGRRTLANYAVRDAVACVSTASS